MPQHVARSHAPARPRRDRRAGSGTDTRRPRTPVTRAPKAATPDARAGRSEFDRKFEEALRAPAPEPRTFAELGLPKAMVLALARRDITTPFAIQARALPDAIAGRDLLGRAETGSGKTLAFGLPMLARLADGGTARGAAPRGLVLVPTRELARQVADTLVPLGHTVGLSVAMVYGGAPIGRQISALRAGVDVVVATPGRLLDLLDRGAVTLSAIEITVLDEADHMADMGFLPDVRRILNATPTGGQRLLFSATLDSAVVRLVQEYLPEPVVHAIASDSPSVETMDHRMFTVSAEHKVTVAAEIAARPARTLFFVATKRGADRLAKHLSDRGAPAAAIHGNLNQNQRIRALAAFANGSPRVLVATDVAARGIHVDDVDLIVHFDPPNDDKTYLHRSGRTARAGASGSVVSLVEHSQVRASNRMHRDAGIHVEQHTVAPGSDPVRAVATSGTPIVVVAPAAAPTRARQSPNRRRSGAGRGRP